MENIAPPLQLLIEVRFAMEKGIPVKKAILAYIDQDPTDRWRSELATWLRLAENNKPSELSQSRMSITRKHCLEVLFRGIKGEAIYSQICSLEEEVFKSSQLELDEFIATLPIKSLIPLLFLQFPALILMLIGPLLSSFFSQ